MEGAYSAGRAGERCLRDGLVEGAYKRDGERLVEGALSAESAGVRERLRRILLNWAVHFPVKGSLQEDDDERLVEERLDEGDEKRDGYRTMRECTGEDVTKGTVRGV